MRRCRKDSAETKIPRYSSLRGFLIDFHSGLIQSYYAAGFWWRSIKVRGAELVWENVVCVLNLAYKVKEAIWEKTEEE